MNRRTFIGILLTVACVSASAQSGIQQSHIEANVPSAELFDQVLQRDLLAYFKASAVPSAIAVDYELLRQQSTQSGVSYPKYYAWVTIKNTSGPVQQGAVRVAAVGLTHFEVTNFLSSVQLKANPREARAVFPEPLVALVLQRAGAK